MRFVSSRAHFPVLPACRNAVPGYPALHLFDLHLISLAMERGGKLCATVSLSWSCTSRRCACDHQALASQRTWRLYTFARASATSTITSSPCISRGPAPPWPGSRAWRAPHGHDTHRLAGGCPPPRAPWPAPLTPRPFCRAGQRGGQEEQGSFIANVVNKEEEGNLLFIRGYNTASSACTHQYIWTSPLLASSGMRAPSAPSPPPPRACLAQRGSGPACSRLSACGDAPPPAPASAPPAPRAASPPPPRASLG